MSNEEGPSLTDILQAIGTHVAENRTELSERDVETAFFDEDFFTSLGYEQPGLDIRQERTIADGTRPDIITSRDTSSVRAVYEFKEPQESLTSHKPQLKGYVDQLDADAGVLTNGLDLWLYDGTSDSLHRILTLSLPRTTGKDSESTIETLVKFLGKDEWELTNQNDVDTYVAETAASPLNLDNEVAQTYFFDTFRFDRHGPFGDLVEAGMELLDELREADREFVTGSFEFWRRSYARLPDEDNVPKAWERFVTVDGDIEEEQLADFMFSLESGFALLSRLFLAKAADDYQFFTNRPLRTRLEGLDDAEPDSDEIDPTRYVSVVDELFSDLQEELIESLFEDDIFLWWADGFDSTGDDSLESETIPNDEALKAARTEFARAVAELLLSVLNFDFSRVDNVDLLGGLYQNYFDEETRKALGEFYTPAGVVELILNRIEYTGGSGIATERLIDPACGSGTFLSDAVDRYLEDVRQQSSGQPDWKTALEQLCLGPRIVGLDIHPFAVLMAQMSITLSILDPYKKAKASDESFTLRRLPVFRTNSLTKESHTPGSNLSGTGQQTLRDIGSGDDEAEVPIVLPITSEVTDDAADAENPFIETTITLPRYDAIRDLDNHKTGVATYGDYFQVLLALLDVVKAHVSDGEYSYTPACLSIEEAITRYLDGPVGDLESFLSPFVDSLLATLADLEAYDDGSRLIPIFEDVALSVILKNYLSYDYVVANPPYVEANNIDTEVKKDLEEMYPQTTTEKYDLYCPFYQRGIERLRDGGTIGYITPNQFMVTAYGRGVRSYLDDHTTIQELYDFRDSGVFADATNYPVVVVAEKSQDQSQDSDDDSIHCVRVKRVDEDDIEDSSPEANDVPKFGGLTAEVVEENEPVTIDTSLDERVLTAITETFDETEYSDPFIDVFQFKQSDLREEYWASMPPAEWSLFKTIEEQSDTMLRGFLDLHAGTQTGENGIYIVTPIDVDRVDAEETGGTVEAIPKGSSEPVTLERDLLRPWLRGSDVERWRPEWSGEHVIFPYKEVQGNGGVESVPLEPKEMQELDETWSYLMDHKEALQGREGGVMENREDWYAFTAPKSHIDLSRPKVIAAETASDTRFALDEDGSWLFKSAYGAPFPAEFADRREYLAAYLNSNVFDFYLKHVSSLKSGGHYKYTTSYVGRVPAITDVDDALQSKIESTVESLTQAIDLRQKTKRFPEAYLTEVTGEIRTIEHEWEASHSPITAADIEQKHDMERNPFLDIDDGTELIGPTTLNESEQLATYVEKALVHRSVTQGETTRIHYPVDPGEQTTLLDSLNADLDRIEETDFDTLEAELNSEIYDLFDIDEDNQEMIREFLDLFSEC